MLGRKLVDRFAVESDIKSAKGLGLLDLETEFFKRKKTVQAVFKIHEKAAHILDIEPYKSMQGYEIHMGKTKIRDEHIPLFLMEDGQQEGIIVQDTKKKNFILGTYIHGIFDNTQFIEAVVKKIYKEKSNNTGPSKKIGKTPHLYSDYRTFKEEQYDKLSDLLEQNLDTKLLQSIIEQGI